jgi:hypothetical protein
VNTKAIKNVRPGKLLEGESRHLKGIRSKIDDVKLSGSVFRATVTDAVVEAKLIRTIEGASTVTIAVHDPKGELRRSKLLTGSYDIELDGLHFRLVAVSRQGDTLTLTHEDREVARLRKARGPLKAYRDQLTRAEFLLQMAREVKPPIPFYSPELHARQPIESARQGRQRATERKSERGGKGLAGVDITVKGAKASSEQVSNIERVLNTGLSHGANKKVLVSAVMTITQESFATNLSGGDAPGYSGLFQQNDSWPGDPRDIEKAATNYFTDAPTTQGGAIGYDRAHPSASPGQIAQAVQASAHPSAYDQWENEATKTVEAFAGGAGATLTTSREVEKRYAFARKANESSWDAMGRLAEEVNWRRFVANGILYYVAEPDLLDSEIRFVVNDGKPGIEDIGFEWDMGQEVDEVAISARTRDWAAPPGTVAAVHGQGPADGRYIVSSIETNLLVESAASITLKRPQKPLPEPAPETRTVTSSVGGGAGDSRRGTAGGLRSVRIGSAEPGSPAWGGTKAIFEQFVHPFMQRQGTTRGSEKRSYNTGSGISDHFVGSTNAYATDYGTSEGAGPATALAEAMGQRGWSPGTYDRFDIRVDGTTFSVQILWAVPDHYDHVHVGINRG